METSFICTRVLGKAELLHTSSVQLVKLCATLQVTGENKYEMLLQRKCICAKETPNWSL